ncbi:MAG: hypothetical protein NVS3B28_23190 [Candidatus Velthaea sp.]
MNVPADERPAGGSSIRTFFASPALLVFAVCAAFSAIRTVTAPTDGDIYWQHWLGESILKHGVIPHTLGSEVSSATGAPWVAHEWLLSSALAVLAAHGLDVLVPAICIACTVMVLALAAIRALERGASIVSTMVLLVVTMLMMAPSMGLRIQVFSWLFVALLLFVLPHPRGRWLAVPLTLVWANLHASAVLSPLLICAYAIGRGADERAERRPLVALTALAAAATLATPLGVALPRYAFGMLSNPAVAFIDEWQRPGLPVFALAIACMVAIAFVPRDRVGSGERLVTLALFAILAGSVRQVPIFFIGAGPFAAAALCMHSRNLIAGSKAAVALGAAVSCALFAGLLLTVHSIGRSAPPLPLSAADYITNLPNARVFCNDFAWCGMLLGHSGVRVFLDGRADPFPRRVWSDYKLIRLDSTWNETLARNGLDTVLVGRGDVLSSRIAMSKDWRRVYRDRYYEVYRFRARS